MAFIPFLLIGKWVSNGDKFLQLTNTTDYVSFIIISSIFYGLIEGSVFTISSYLRREIRIGTLELLMTVPVPKIFLAISHFLSSLLRRLLINLVLLFCALIIFRLEIKGSIFLTTFIFCVSLLFIFGIACIYASITLRWKRSVIPSIVNAFLYAICGVMYPTTVLPKWCQSISSYVPYTYIFDALRGSLLKTKTLVPIAIQIQIIFISGLIFSYLGWLLLLNTMRYELQKGTIGVD